jgi:predicted Zn-dependent protease
MQLAAQACYDPSAAIQVFQKLGAFEKQTSMASTPDFLRTHPLSDVRVKRVKNELSTARQTFELSECGQKSLAVLDLFW